MIPRIAHMQVHVVGTSKQEYIRIDCNSEKKPASSSKICISKERKILERTSYKILILSFKLNVFVYDIKVNFYVIFNTFTALSYPMFKIFCSAF